MIKKNIFISPTTKTIDEAQKRVKREDLAFEKKIKKIMKKLKGNKRKS